MKKWTLGIATAIALVVVLILPEMISADSSGTVAVTGNIAPTITSVSPNSGVQGNTYSSIVITGTDFTGATVVSFGTGITVNSKNVDSATQITASITITSGATPGARDVSVTASGVMATKTSAFTVVATSLSVTAPSAISLGNMVRGQTASAHSATPGSVSSNADNWQVVAKDANTGNNSGRMLKGGSTPLHNQLRIGRTTSPSTNAGDPGFIYTQADGTSLPFYVEQDVTSDDAAGAYTITIAFIGSNP